MQPSVVVGVLQVRVTWLHHLLEMNNIREVVLDNTKVMEPYPIFFAVDETEDVLEKRFSCLHPRRHPLLML